MSHQYSIERGQGSVLYELSSNNVPELQSFFYETHAPYLENASAPTLILGSTELMVDRTPVVLTTVSHQPDQSVSVTNRLTRPVSRILMGGSGELYKTSAPLGVIAVHATMSETHISLFGPFGDQFVRIENLPEEQLLAAIDGPMRAAQAKMILRKGRWFSAV